MFLNRIKRYFAIRKRESQGVVTADELVDKDVIYSELMEVAGSGSGLIVLMNWEYVYRGYEEFISGGVIEGSCEVEENLFTASINFVEDHVSKYGSRKLISEVGDVVYYSEMNRWMSSNKVSSEFQGEVVNGKWGLLKRGLRDFGNKWVKEWSKGSGSSSLKELKIEERIEPIFNKVLSQVLDEVDGGTLTAGEKLKLFDKLSYLLAEMKGERKSDIGVQVTHNNVFQVIMERKKEEGSLISSRAIELLEGEDYKLV